MLELMVTERELFNENTMEIIKIPDTKLQLEHSLISLKKWESKWHKPFLNGNAKGQTDELSEKELLDYIRCMTINRVTTPEVYEALTDNEITKIVDYIKDPMTATWFGDQNNKLPNRRVFSSKIITNEIIYYWMIALNIPTEYEKWHLNQLMTLIKVVNLENQPKKKMNKNEEIRRRNALNDARRKKYNTKG